VALILRVGGGGVAFVIAVLLGAVRAIAADIDPQLAATAREARQTVVVINWFYTAHHACPQPSRPEEIAVFRGELGDGFSVEPHGQFVEIRGISMPGVGWLYYSSLDHPDKCTLWRKLGWDPALIWRRHRDGGRWLFDPGDGGPERTLKIAP
jgi:hypothetical protein